MMLRAHEIAVGSFPEAEGLALMLPRTDRDQHILISSAGVQKWAIYLGPDRYNAYPCGDSANWRGVLAQNVDIELDSTSMFDPDRTSGPLGSLVREGTILGIITLGRDEDDIRQQQQVAILKDLPASRAGYAAGFTRWQIVLGSGESTRVLLSIDADPPTAND